MTRWGIGPRIAVPSLLLALATWTASSRWPDVFVLHFPYVLRVAGAALVGLGLLIWATGAITVMRAYNRGELVTTGVFALVRHPVYAGWISMVFPGLALLTGAWPFFLITLAGYAIFKRLIHHEDEYLQQRFSKAYVDYRQRVNALLPVPRFWK